MKDDPHKQLDELLKIAEKIANAKIPDFMKESLFNLFVKGKPTKSAKEAPSNEEEVDVPGAGEFAYPSNMRRYMRQFDISDKQVGSVFFLEPDNVDYLVTELGAKNNADGLRKCIMLVGLKNLLETNVAKVPLNQVRELAGDKGVYDAANFSSYMKRNTDILKSYKPSEDSELSGPGIKESMKYLKTLAVE